MVGKLTEPSKGGSHSASIVFMACFGKGLEQEGKRLFGEDCVLQNVHNTSGESFKPRRVSKKHLSRAAGTLRTAVGTITHHFN
jgi:hypothetical protein